MIFRDGSSLPFAWIFEGLASSDFTSVRSVEKHLIQTVVSASGGNPDDAHTAADCYAHEDFYYAREYGLIWAGLFTELGRLAYEEYADQKSAWSAVKDRYPETEFTRENELDFKRGMDEVGTAESGGDWVEVNLDRLDDFIISASEVTRLFPDLHEKTVQQACLHRRVRCWKLGGRDWLVWKADAEKRWKK